MKTISAAELDKKFDDGEDISEYLDWSKARRVDWEHELVELELPKAQLAELDAEVARRGTTRSHLISTWIRERLEKASAAAE
ncbi:type II toxin-antitoxin system BrnA family antitoxin [Pseudorhizobium flavum]|uniref:type II toxin-antitoxin system BrnA family antitoxin n=1 Tax=Pseudorhizobium flavum TaxID=1335061 RepID=UPI0037701640